jgi:hypothetical protein
MESFILGSDKLLVPNPAGYVTLYGLTEYEINTIQYNAENFVHLTWIWNHHGKPTE